MSSVSFESNQIKPLLTHMETMKMSIQTAFTGTLENRSVILMNSGIGKSNAAHGTTFLCRTYPLTLFVNFGIGGAYPHSGLSVGDIAVAQKEIYGDEGIIEKNGWYGIERIGIPLFESKGKGYFNEFHTNKKFFNIAMNVLKPPEFKIFSGPFLTVSTASGTLKRAMELEKRFAGICENMEGAAAAHICTMYGVPFLELRGISNIVEDRDRNQWNLSLAADNCQRAVIKVLRNLSEST